MCGIVRNPTRRKNFDPVEFPNLPASVVWNIVTVCEDVHIPHIATSLVLHFANTMASKKGFIIEMIPFALYENGKRTVSNGSTKAEAAVMHLAMAGSARRVINDELGKVGLILELGHCCAIEMWEKEKEREALGRSHDKNVYRADKLRGLGESSEEVLSAEGFLSSANGFNKRLIGMMLELTAERQVAA